MKKIFCSIIAIMSLSTAVHAVVYPDSVQQAAAEQYSVHRGWNFEFGGMIGTGRMEYAQLGSKFTPAHVENQFGFPAWGAGIGINYYFVPWMGLGTGVDIAGYTNTAKVAKNWVVSGEDIYGDQYVLTATPWNIRERQDLMMLEVPLALKFRAMPKSVGFTATLGAKLGIPMDNYNNLLRGGGVMENSVYYEHWDLTMHDVPGVLQNYPVYGSTVTGTKRLPMGAYNTINWAAYAELGMLFRLHQRVDMNLSLYGTYYINNVMSNIARTNLGFADSYVNCMYEAPFTEKYDKILLTNEVQTLHPWQVGLKIGFQINASKRDAEREYDKAMRRQRREERAAAKALAAMGTPVPQDTIDYEALARQEWERQRAAAIQQIRDLAAQYDIDLCDLCDVRTIIMHDTVYVRLEPQLTVPESRTVAQELDDVLSASVIYFNFDEAVPLLEPEDILIRIAAVLRRHPEQKVYVDGHACKVGKPDYNKRLAQRRADAVAAMLRSLGVQEEQMIVRSLGSEHPYRYTGVHQLSKDRRVEIIPVEEHVAENIAAPSSNGELATSETVQPGSRLAQIARRHYGEPEYWVFIYEANLDKISNPGQIPVGVNLIIPDLSARLAGKTKEEALEVARALMRSLMNK